MSTAQRNRYRADLRDTRFQLFEQGRLGELLGQGPFGDWGVDEVNAVIDMAYEFSTEVTGPLNGSGDAQGCRVVDGRVKTPEGFGDAWRKLFELGLKTLSFPSEWNGQNGPFSVQVAIEEFLCGSNTAFSMYPGLAIGAGELIMTFATPAQKETYLRPIVEGRWGGTMCLTEPQAGSDVGAAATRAKRTGDGRFKIQGTKIYISSGDQDITDNVVHLVLARIEGAPAGTKGLSLFIVPRVRVNADSTPGPWNDVALGGIEHKMGINGSATCVLNFGENDDCYGELVGGVENEGIKQMFLMMNHARLAVGLQGLGLCGSSYLAALAYAKDRKQGPSFENFKDPKAPKVAILQHPDVRRSLLEMKARTEALRALVVRIAAHSDRVRLFEHSDPDQATQNQGQVELLTPIVKAWGSDQAFKVSEMAVQVLGGAGYIRDYGVEQDLRDAKIFSIYEGTNHIQAMDLVGRKLGQRGGANVMVLAQEISGFVDVWRDHGRIGAATQQLQGAVESTMGAVMRLQSWAMEGKLSLVGLYANRFLDALSNVVAGYLLLEGASIAIKALESGSTETDFYEGKVHAAVWFARNVVATVPALVESFGIEDDTAMSISDASFATI